MLQLRPACRGFAPVLLPVGLDGSAPLDGIRVLATAGRLYQKAIAEGAGRIIDW